MTWELENFISNDTIFKVTLLARAINLWVLFPVLICHVKTLVTSLLAQPFLTPCRFSPWQCEFTKNMAKKKHAHELPFPPKKNINGLSSE
jgi:hypothetical protein